MALLRLTRTSTVFSLPLPPPWFSLKMNSVAEAFPPPPCLIRVFASFRCFFCFFFPATIVPVFGFVFIYVAAFSDVVPSAAAAVSALPWPLRR